MLNENGDLLIQDNNIQMINDSNLLCQTIKTALNTKKGEWFFNTSLGLNFDNILGKHTINNAYLQHEIEQVLVQVDDTLTITKFEYEYDKQTRVLKIHFTAVNESGESVEVINTWE